MKIYEGGNDHATLRRGMVTSPTANDGSVAQIITTHSDDFPRKVGETFTGTLKTRHSQFDSPEDPSEMPAWHDNGKTKHVAQYVGGLGHDGVPSGTGNFRGSAVDWHNAKLNKDPAPSSDIFHSDGDWKPVEYTGQWKDGESGAKRKRTTTAHSELTEASFARARRFAPPRARWAGGQGMKNDFGGHDNHHYNNVYAYVGQGLGVCSQLAGHEDYFYNNRVVMTGSNVGGFTCSGVGKTVVHDNQYFNPSGSVQECKMSFEDWQKQGEDKGSTASALPSDDTIISWAKSLLDF